MKSATDPRHKKRQKIVKILFAESFTHQDNLGKTAKSIIKSKAKVDKKIQNAAPTWPVEKLNRVDLSILRLAIYELEKGETPPKVVIDEAVELAKEFGSENSPSFVNGVLGTVYKELETDKDSPKEKKTKQKKVTKDTVEEKEKEKEKEKESKNEG